MAEALAAKPCEELNFIQRICFELEETFPVKVARIPPIISNYLKLHQFNDWLDIYNDVNNGYYNCCLKEILFQYLYITDHQQRMNLHSTLLQCLRMTNSNTIHTQSGASNLYPSFNKQRHQLSRPSQLDFHVAIDAADWYNMPQDNFNNDQCKISINITKKVWIAACHDSISNASLPVSEVMEKRDKIRWVQIIHIGAANVYTSCSFEHCVNKDYVLLYCQSQKGITIPNDIISTIVSYCEELIVSSIEFDTTFCNLSRSGDKFEPWIGEVIFCDNI